MTRKEIMLKNKYSLHKIETFFMIRLRTCWYTYNVLTHTHTHTHTHTYTHTQTHIYIYIQLIPHLSLSLSLSHTHTHICIYIYIYCHPQTDCFVVSQLFSVASHIGRFKRGLKPAKIYVKLSIILLSYQTTYVSSGIIRHYVVAFVCLHFALLNTNVLDSLEELCIMQVAAINSFAKMLHHWGKEYILSSTDRLFRWSLLFSVARYVGRFKLGLKPSQYYVRLSIILLSYQTTYVSSGIIKHYVVAFINLHFALPDTRMLNSSNRKERCRGVHQVWNEIQKRKIKCKIQLTCFTTNIAS